MRLEITLFTDPACPFAFSAEPVRMRLLAGVPRCRRCTLARTRDRRAVAPTPARPGHARRTARRSRADRGGRPRRGPRPCAARGVVHTRRRASGAAGRRRSRTISDSRRTGSRPQARRPEGAAALHRAELRDGARRQRRHPGRHPRLQSDRGLRDGDREPRSRADRSPNASRMSWRGPASHSRRQRSHS